MIPPKPELRSPLSPPWRSIEPPKAWPVPAFPPLRNIEPPPRPLPEDVPRPPIPPRATTSPPEPPSGPEPPLPLIRNTPAPRPPTAVGSVEAPPSPPRTCNTRVASVPLLKLTVAGGGEPTTCSTAIGAVMPMPTFVLEVALFTPLILPSTSELLCVTCARDPMAVALLTPADPLVESPMKVLPESFVGVALAPAVNPKKEFPAPLLLNPASLPTNTLPAVGKPTRTTVWVLILYCVLVLMSPATSSFAPGL